VGPIDLALARGSRLSFVGPSGVGKSTLLRLLLGLATPDTGEVRFDGAPLSRVDLMELRRRVGYVVQGGGLFTHLTAEGNAALVARWLGWDERRVRSGSAWSRSWRGSRRCWAATPRGSRAASGSVSPMRASSRQLE
jgi:osmoprotectant transport system ATP-binding protein